MCLTTLGKLLKFGSINNVEKVLMKYYNLLRI